MDLCVTSKLRTGTEIPNTQGTCCATWRRCVRWLRLVCRIHRARIFRVTRDGRQKFWMWLPDFMDAQDTRVMQYQHKAVGITRIRVLHQSGIVYHDPAAENHGRKCKTPWYSSQDICTDTRWQDCCGSDNWKNFGRKWLGKFQTWECLCLHREKVFSPSMWAKKKGGKGNMLEPMMDILMMENRAWKQRPAPILFLSKSDGCLAGRGPTQIPLLDHMTWRAFDETRGKILRIGKTRKSSNFTKSPHRVWVITKFKDEELDRQTRLLVVWM